MPEPATIAAHIAERLVAGDRVLVVTDDHPAMLRTIAELVAVEPGVRIHRTNGQERASHPSGGVVFVRSARGHGHRGLSVDLVILVTDASRVHRLIDEVSPAVLPGGELRIVVAA